MVITSLYKSETGADSFLDAYDPNTRIVWFWIHQTRRLTDGHIAIPDKGPARVRVNWTFQGNRDEIAERAIFDEYMWRESAGLREWSPDRLGTVLTALQIDLNERSPFDAFADALAQPIREAERELNRPRLSIQWDIGERDRNSAISMRNSVLSKAQAVLNDAGLLVDLEAESAGLTTVEAILEVTQFDAAKSILWQHLSTEERGHNCRILDCA